MQNIKKTTVALIATTQILAITLLAACTSASAAGLKIGEDSGTLANICHATGDQANPYEEISLNQDIYPVPVNGCPASAAVINNGNITICHATNDKAKPYKKITVSVNGLNGHGSHEGDIITLPESGCPAASTVNLTETSGDKITICHATGSKKNPYNEITISVSGLNGHNGHADDIIPAPADGCPISKP